MMEGYDESQEDEIASFYCNSSHYKLTYKQLSQLQQFAA